MTDLAWLAAAVAAVAGAVTQAVTGFGFSLVCAPVLVLAAGPAQGVRLANALAIVVNVVLLAGEHRSTRVGDALGLLMPAAVVAPFAAYAVHRTDTAVLSVAAGAVTLVSAALLAGGARGERLRGPAGTVVAGGVSATMNVVSGVGGPAVAMFAVNAGWPAASVRPTLQLYFLGLNIISIAALGLPDQPGNEVAGLVAALALGLVVGRWTAARLDAVAVRRLALTVAAVGGLAAVVRGLASAA
jgi:uncharacterized membrane protein YfcA